MKGFNLKIVLSTILLVVSSFSFISCSNDDDFSIEEQETASDGTNSQFPILMDKDHPDATVVVDGKTITIHFDENEGLETRGIDDNKVYPRDPNATLAQNAKMSTEEFEDFFLQVCNTDYAKMNKAMQALKAIMEKTDKVHIKSPNTDLTFSIKGQTAVPCAGEYNIPDGEVFTSPVKNSINGFVQFNVPCSASGKVLENIKFEIKDGKIINSECSEKETLDHLLDTDEGSRYFGEFALGVNPYVEQPMLDTLWDEKISGSFHMAFGMCLPEAPNGNASAVHYDLVQIQTPEYGGGEIWFDGVKIRENGLFILPELVALNPENLV